jgi:putative acetyltransferase
MLIRAYYTSDAEALHALYVQSVLSIGPLDYSGEQVKAWASVAPTPQKIEALYSDGRATFLAVDDHGQVCGFCDLESDGHIEFLYCAPASTGQGVAFALYQALEAQARSQGLNRIYVEASEAAQRFFQRQGFMTLKRRDLQIENVPIHNFAMEKRL